MGDLNRRQIPLIKLSLGVIRRPQFLADIAVCQATLDLAPVLTVIDPLLQPIRVIPQSILLVSSPRNNLSNALVGDDECEDCEAE